MASTFTTLGIEKMATGENAGTWGDKTNTNLDIINVAVSGYVEQAVTSGGTLALSITDGAATATAQNAVIKLTGTITGNSIVTVPDSVEKVYIVTNGTSGAYTVQFKTASGTGVTFGVSEKTTKLLYSDGTNIVDAGFSGASDMEGRELILDADGDTSLTADTDDQIDIKIAGADDFQFTANTFTAQSGSTIAAQALTATTITASGIVKTDDTTEATSTTDGSLQTDGGLSVAKDAVIGDDLKLLSDSAVLSFGADSDTTLTHTDGTGLTLNSTNKFLFRDSALYINSSTDGQLDIVADTEVQIAATTIDINGAVAMDGAITGATNITLSGELDAATGDFSGDVDVDGTLEADAYTLGGSSFIKLAGTNFTNSLLLGHTTTGTLNNALGNVGVGVTALDALTTGDNNVAVGFGAGSAISQGTQNVAIGQDALTVNNNGNENTALGGRASRLLANGDGNTTVGYNAGTAMNSADADYNILIGHSAGDNITEGAGNVIIGSVDAAAVDGDRTLKIAGYDGSTTTTWISGDNSGNLTFAGTATADSGKDVILGKNAGTNFTGSLLIGHATSGTLNAAQHNTGVGITALDALTSADQNTAVGGAALTAVTTGNDNIGIGYNAGSGITGAPGNTIVGVNAFTGSATDSNSGYNTVVGQNAMNVASGATFNTALGRDAGREVSTGDYNIFLGYNAGANDSTAGITTGSGNVIIGTVDPASRTGDRQLKITGNDGSTATTWISGDNSGNLTFAADVTLGDDLHLDSDAAVLKFGDDGEITLTHVADTGLALKHTATADDKPIKLTLQTGETDIAADDVIGAINFQAPDEGTGTDAILVAAGIEAVSEGDFAADNNATKLSFKTAASAAAAETMSLSSAGLLTIADDLVVKSGGTIGGAGDTDLLTLGSAILTVAGEVQMTTLDIGGTNVTTTAAEINLIDGGTARGTTAVADGDGLLVNDAGTMRMTNVTTLKTYFQSGVTASSIAADDISAGDAAVTIGNGSTSADITIDSGANITLDADGTTISLQDGGTEFLKFVNDSGSGVIRNTGQDKDINFLGNDGGSTITALALDMSAGGTATFNHDIIIADGGQIGSASDVDAIAIASDGVVTFSQAPVVPIGGLDIDGATDIGEAIVDADLFIVDNGAGGTNRKVAASSLVTYINANSSAATVGKAIAMAIVFG